MRQVTDAIVAECDGYGGAALDWHRGHVAPESVDPAYLQEFYDLYIR
jgi:hypothetical protein